MPAVEPLSNYHVNRPVERRKMRSAIRPDDPSLCSICGCSADEHPGCDCCLPARPWEIHIAWLLRGALLATAITFIAGGAWLYAVVCVASVLLVAVPAYLAHTSKANLPVELELILLWFLVADNTLGRLVELYGTPWFDKALHLGNSGFIGVLVVYVLLFTSRLRTSPWFNGVLILLVTLGTGALWEILEYGLDSLLHRGAQGYPIMGPLDDTMWDLILDGAGGALGAVLGSTYIHLSNRSRCRFAAFAHYLSLRHGEASTASEDGSDGIRSAESHENPVRYDGQVADKEEPQ